MPAVPREPVTPTAATGPAPLAGGRTPSLSEDDLWYFREGTHSRLYEVLGGHLLAGGGASFGVWAPAARTVWVVGDWNGWMPGVDGLEHHGDSGIWQGRAPRAAEGHRYKFHLDTPSGTLEKADPLAFAAEEAPATASVLTDLRHAWSDDAWMADRGRRSAHDAPIAIYELHHGSWRPADGGQRAPTYRELAEPLAEHLEAHGFTHVELLPVMEHPFYGSWGYQTTGYFAPTSRFGSPTDLMWMIDRLHQRGFGVILDWVPSHFPADAHALGRFDGTALYEHPDPRKGWHPDWNSLIFDYDRPEVRAFLTSSACWWLERYHADGLRVDAVASMLYLDYSRPEGEWLPNEQGGNENLGALRFLKEMNETVYERFPGVQTIAEESTAWPMVSRPTDVGGLGFGFKWDMGWMNDTLDYFAEEPVHRRWHQGELSFRMVYADAENYVLPLSHDEVVHGKRSLLGRMPGDDWQRFANLRALFGWMYAMPGKKLLFMGAELAPEAEWDHDSFLDWSLAERPANAGVGAWIAHLNGLYRSEAGLHRMDCDQRGFDWVDTADADASVLSLLRSPVPFGEPIGEERLVLVVANLTPVPREGYRIGVPAAGSWEVLADSDDTAWGGSGHRGGTTSWRTDHVSAHGRPQSLALTLPPLSVMFLAPTATAHPAT